MGAAPSCGFHAKPGRIEVGLYATFQDPAPPAIREAAREELAAAAMPIGVLVHWRSEADSSPDSWWHRVATVRFLGHCDASELPKSPPHPWKFGSTWVSDRKVIPFALKSAAMRSERIWRPPCSRSKGNVPHCSGGPLAGFSRTSFITSWQKRRARDRRNWKRVVHSRGIGRR